MMSSARRPATNVHEREAGDVTRLGGLIEAETDADLPLHELGQSLGTWPLCSDAAARSFRLERFRIISSAVRRVPSCDFDGEGRERHLARAARRRRWRA
jgi:hypothetical protein